MTVEILISYAGGTFLLDYEKIVAAADAQKISVDDKILAIKKNLSVIERYWSENEN